MIKDFIKKWEEGYKIVLGVKNKSKENKLMFLIRRIFYYIMFKISEQNRLKILQGLDFMIKNLLISSVILMNHILTSADW